MVYNGDFTGRQCTLNYERTKLSSPPVYQKVDEYSSLASELYWEAQATVYKLGGYRDPDMSYEGVSATQQEPR